MKKLFFICSFLCAFGFAAAQPCTPPTVTILEKEVCQNDSIRLVFTGAAPFELNYTFNNARQTIIVLGMDTTLIATQSGENLFVVYDLVDGCSLEIPDKDGVKVNGVVWAKYNVDTPGMFAENSEDYGMFYQWNSKIAWSATDPLVSIPAGSIWNSAWEGNNAMTWESTNNVCPTGWRVPTHSEQQSLGIGTWTNNYNNIGVRGRIFSDGINILFLPAAGYREIYSWLNLPDMHGYRGFYWSSTRYDSPHVYAYNMSFSSDYTYNNYNTPQSAHSVRCVKDIPFDTNPKMTATITVHPIKYTTGNISIYENESYLFNGKYYNETGFYADTLQTSLGCDSIVTLNLKVKGISPTVTILGKNVCQNDSIRLIFTGVAPFELDYSLNSVREKITVFDMDTAFVATQIGENIIIFYDLIDGNGCSVHDTKDGVEINGLIWATRNVDAPGTFTENPEDTGMFYQWNSKVGWSSADPMINSNGETMWNFAIGSSEWERQNNPCPNGFRVPGVHELYMLGGQWTDNYNYTGIAGRICADGVNEIFLPAGGIRNSFDGALLVKDNLWGNPISVYWGNGGGSTYTSAYGMYNQRYEGYYSLFSQAYGVSVRCVKDKNIIADTITVHQTKTKTLTATICPTATYLFNGNHYNKTGIYTDTLQTSFGCDSIVTLNLTVLILDTTRINAAICPNESYLFNGTYYKEAGIYTDTLQTSFGCDSIVTLKLTVNPAFDLQETITICDSELPFTFRDIVFGTETVSGEYVFNKKTVNGCDSITTLSLTVNPTFDLLETLVICDDKLPFVFRDTTFKVGTVSGTYIFKRKTVFGCDSTVTLTLRVNEPNFPEYITICDSELPFTFRDITFEAGTQSGDYVFNHTSLYGCDSIVTLHLTVNESFTVFDTIVLYENDLPFTYLNMTFSVGAYSGDYVFPRKTAFGCDSIIHLNLTIHQTLRQTICESELPLAIRDTWFLQGTQSDVYMVDNGLTTLILTVNPTPQFTISNNDIITCTNADYEKIVALNFSPPFNANASLQWTIIHENGDRSVLPNTTSQILRANAELFPDVGAYRIEALYQYQSNGRLCNSATTTINYAVFEPPRPPIVAPKIMCEGELTPLQAFGSPLIQWISVDKKLLDWTGETYDFHRLGQSNIPLGTYEFELYDIDAVSGCESERVQLSFEITPPANPQIIGRNEFCLQAIEEMYAIKTAARGSDYFWKTSGSHYNYSKDGNPYSPNRYVDWHGVGIDTLSVYERTYAGCEGYDTLVVFIADYPKPYYTWSFQSASTTIEFTDSSYQAPIIAKNPDGTFVEIPLTYTMEWFFDTNDNRDTAVVDMFVEYFDRFNPIQIPDYTYGFKYPLLTVTNNFGCRARYVTEIFVDIPNGIYIPNAFSPSNAAASVRIFKPVAYNLEYCKVWIYDKWGNLLWYGNRVENGVFIDEWNGTYNGELLQSDVYIWKIDAKFLNGTTWAGQKKTLGGYTNFGSVMLIR